MRSDSHSWHVWTARCDGGRTCACRRKRARSRFAAALPRRFSSTDNERTRHSVHSRHARPGCRPAQADGVSCLSDPLCLCDNDSLMGAAASTLMRQTSEPLLLCVWLLCGSGTFFRVKTACVSVFLKGRLFTLNPVVFVLTPERTHTSKIFITLKVSPFSFMAFQQCVSFDLNNHFISVFSFKARPFLTLKPKQSYTFLNWNILIVCRAIFTTVTIWLY